MNPLEYVDTLETIQIDKILLENKQEYTKDEVIDLLRNVANNYRKAIYNGEYIFNIEELDKDTITVNDKEFTVQKLITNDDKYLLFLQITDIISDDFISSDLHILADEINKAIKKTTNIAGVMLLPPEMNISLITAKLDTISYAKKLTFTEEDIAMIKKYNTTTSTSTSFYTPYSTFYDYF